MADRNLDERELAVGAALANEMMREDRRDEQRERRSRLSTGSAWGSIAFVAISSIGMLVLMMVFAK